MRDFINVYTIGVPRAFVKRAFGVLSQLRSKDFSSGRATPSAAARPGEPDRLVSGLRSEEGGHFIDLVPLLHPCPLRPSTASSGHRPCAPSLYARFDDTPRAVFSGIYAEGQNRYNKGSLSAEVAELADA